MELAANQQKKKNDTFGYKTGMWQGPQDKARRAAFGQRALCLTRDLEQQQKED